MLDVMFIILGSFIQIIYIDKSIIIAITFSNRLSPYLLKPLPHRHIILDT